MELSSFGASFIYRDGACIGKQLRELWDLWGEIGDTGFFRELDLYYSYASFTADYALLGLTGETPKKKTRVDRYQAASKMRKKYHGYSINTGNLTRVSSPLT
jgi:hypothetical protein